MCTKTMAIDAGIASHQKTEIKIHAHRITHEISYLLSSRKLPAATSTDDEQRTIRTENTRMYRIDIDTYVIYRAGRKSHLSSFLLFG